MGAATRESERAAVAALDAMKRPDAALGGDLLTAARGVASSQQLSVLLTDPGIEATAKAGLVNRVFGSLGADTRSLLTTLVSGRWSSPRDLVDTIEALGFRALARSAKEPLATELFTVQRAISSDPELELALSNQSSPAALRLTLADRILVRAGSATQAIVRHVVALPRGRRAVEALTRAERIVAETNGGLVAVAEVARPLGHKQHERLAAALTAKYGRPVAVNQVVDPSVVGGVRVQIGDEVIDGTVRARLDDLKQRLAG